MELNNEQLLAGYVSEKVNLEDIGLPDCIKNALAAESKCIIFTNLNLHIREEDIQFEENQLSDLNKSLSEEQLELLSVLRELLLEKSNYIKEYMFYSGVKQGINFYKAYHAI